MATYYAELTGGEIVSSVSFEGGVIYAEETLSGGEIYPSGGGANLETLTLSYTPSETAISETRLPSAGYDGFDEVDVSVGAIPSNYVGSGVTRQAAQTIHPSTSDQTIASGKYLDGTQTFKRVTTSNISASNIKNGVVVKVGDPDDDDRIISVTGTYSGSGASLETKSVSYTPSETAISDTLTPSAGYDGFSQVDVDVSAIPSNYVGTGVTRRDSSDLTASGATVTAPSGYYSANATKAIPTASNPYLSYAEIENDGDLYVDLEESSGYRQSGTLGLTLSSAFSVQSAQTITPGTSNQTIASGRYLTGAQTILGDADLIPGNIKKDVEIFGVTGTYEGGSPSPDPYHLKVDPNGLFFCFGGAGYQSGRMSVNTSTATRRSLWAVSGDARAAYGSTSNRTNLHGIPVPSDATTVTLTIDQTCQWSLVEYVGSGSSISAGVGTPWGDPIQANTPLTLTLTSGTDYISFGFRVNSSDTGYTNATEPTSASIDFS